MSEARGADEPDEGGRIFFSGAERSLVEEDEIELTSVGVDIGSSTSHLLFSRITLERLDTRYIVAAREVIGQSSILLTPYAESGDIDTRRLATFVDEAYADAGLARADVDTGALILTGVAVRRDNARAIGELFARDAGRFVAVSAGDRLEAMLAAHGSGADEASANGRTILNLDVGGGTTKLSLCRDGEVLAVTAVEAGARLVVADADGRIERLEEFGERYAAQLGCALRVGDFLDDELRLRLAGAMADHVLAAVAGDELPGWLRLPPLAPVARIDGVIFSGGVSEFLHEAPAQPDFGDLGVHLGKALLERVAGSGVPVLERRGGIRATVIGASQYTVQVSGSTVYVDPLQALPLRNVATVQPHIDFAPEQLDAGHIAGSVREALLRIDAGGGEHAVAVALQWRGSATYHRLHALATGLIEGLAPVLGRGHPLIVVSDGDVGGLFGIHCREGALLGNAIVSIDGIELQEFDFVDIGEVLRATGAVPVVVKSLVFPAERRRLDEATR